MKLLSASNLNGNRRLYQWTAISHSAEGTDQPDVSAIRRLAKKTRLNPIAPRGVLPRQRKDSRRDLPGKRSSQLDPRTGTTRCACSSAAARRIITNNQQRNKKGKPRHEEPKHHPERC
jgi:hypothetical protein